MTSSTITVANVPSITVFVRHMKSCPHKGDELFRRCKCTKHLRWSVNGHQKRQSGKTRSWAIAEEVRRNIEGRFAAANDAAASGTLAVVSATQTTTERAVELFVSSKESQGISAGVVTKYRKELNRLADFLAARGKHFAHD